MGGRQRSREQGDASPTCRAVVVDDHELFRKGLKDLLQSEPGVTVCGESAEENDAFAKIRRLRPDLVTVDITLASGSGLSLVKRIRAMRPAAAILVVSMYDEKLYAERALAAGASGYVCKQAPSEDIVEGIRALRRGEFYFSPQVTHRLVSRASGAPSSGLSSEAHLSPRELEILHLIGQGLTTHEIAAKAHISVSTVETYRDRLKVKLGLANGAELTRHAILWVANLPQ